MTPKSQHLDIGHIDEKNKVLSLDLPRLVDTRMLIQANSGGGKSYLLRLIVERAAGRVQIVLLDPEGEFATLREKVDIALVGQGGELATDVRSAALLARKLAETRVSAIVDLYDLKLPDRRKFVRLFLESLMNTPRSLWHPMLVILDEAHLYSPEKSAGESESTAAVIALMSQGRKRGFAGILSTQRLSKLHKDAAAETNNIVIGRTWLDVDQQRAGDLLGMDKAGRQTLRDLAPGEFYAFGPAFNANGVVRFHADEVATTHPKAGERHLLEVPAASHAIQEIVAQLGDLPKIAEEEARTLADAQRKIVELERQLRARPVQVQPQPPQIETRVEKVEVPVFSAGDIPQLQAMLKAANDILAQSGPIAQMLHKTVENAQKMKSAPVRLPAPRTALPRSIPVAKPVQTGAALEGDEITRPQQSIVDALARFESWGLAEVERQNAAVFANQSPSSSGFTNNLGRLRSLGLIEYPTSGRVALTDAGRARANPPAPIHSVDELHEAWYAKLAKPKVAILRVLIERYPDALSRGELAELAGQSATSSGYTNNLGALRSLGIIDYPRDRPGHVAATKLLFPDL